MNIWKILAMDCLLVILAVSVQGADSTQSPQSQSEKRSVRSVFQKLDAVKLHEFKIEEPTALSNVIQRLNLEIRKHAPELSGLTIRIVPSPTEPLAAKAAEANALMIPNIGPPLKAISIIEIISVTTRYAPVAYTLREDGVEVFPFKRGPRPDMNEKPSKVPGMLYLDISGGYHRNSFSKQIKVREGAKFVIRGNIEGGGHDLNNRQSIILTGRVGYSKDNLVPFLVVTQGRGQIGWNPPRLVPLNMPWAYSGGAGFNGPSVSISLWTEPPHGQELEEATDSREGIDWQRRAAGVHPGTKRYAVEALLPRYSGVLPMYSGPFQKDQMSSPKITTLSGGKTAETYWVAENWRVSVGYNHAGPPDPEDQVTSVKLEQVGVGGKQ